MNIYELNSQLCSDLDFFLAPGGPNEAQPLLQQLARHIDVQRLDALVMRRLPQRELGYLLERDELAHTGDNQSGKKGDACFVINTVRRAREHRAA